MLYILNSAVLTAYGLFEYSPLAIDTAADMVRCEEFTSAIGHEATAQVLSELLLKQIPCNRIQITMQPGEQAIVFRLKFRPEEGKVSTTMNHDDYELGLLTMLDVL